MDVADRVEKALNGIVKLYASVPEFTDRNTPEKYAIYTIAEYDFGLYEKIKAAMYSEGFCYAEGGNVQDDKIYPFTRHYYLDFVIAMER